MSSSVGAGVIVGEVFVLQAIVALGGKRTKNTDEKNRHLEVGMWRHH